MQFDIATRQYASRYHDGAHTSPVWTYARELRYRDRDTV
jgi:hypothetical protein